MEKDGFLNAPHRFKKKKNQHTNNKQTKKPTKKTKNPKNQTQNPQKTPEVVSQTLVSPLWMQCIYMALHSQSSKSWFDPS